MSLYLWAATCGSPTGYFLMSFVAQTRGWRDVFWALLGICGGLWVIMTVSLLFCGETRHSILLAQRAEKARKLNNTPNIDVPDHLKKRGVKELFTVTLMRPFRFLGTEAIIMFAALYNGYLYGLSFLFNTAFALVFGQGHGFDTIGVGVCFLGICAGISLGPLTNIWQERYYQRKVHESGGKNVPEARVQMGKIAAISKPELLLHATAHGADPTTQPSPSPSSGSPGQPTQASTPSSLSSPRRFGAGASTP